jgi:hypothetical protein
MQSAESTQNAGTANSAVEKKVRRQQPLTTKKWKSQKLQASQNERVERKKWLLKKAN